MENFFLTLSAIFAISMIVFVHVTEPPAATQSAPELVEAN